MALKDIWQDLVDGVSDIDSNDINNIAKAVIALEKSSGGGGSGGGSIEIDDEMSDTSTNAVQNKVIKKYVDDSVGDIEEALDTIIAEQENIMAIQDALIGGGSV